MVFSVGLLIGGIVGFAGGLLTRLRSC